jgi:copper homeostasis protein
MDNLLRRAHDALLMAGGGLRPEHVPGLRAAGIASFHIGSAARDTWDAPVDARRVERWRTLIDG